MKTNESFDRSGDPIPTLQRGSDARSLRQQKVGRYRWCIRSNAKHLLESMLEGGLNNTWKKVRPQVD